MSNYKIASLVVAAFAAARIGGQLGLAAGGAVLVLAWLARSWFKPWRRCWWPWCRGNPRNGDEKAFNIFCPICGSRGRIRRWGSRLLKGGFGEL